MYGIMFSLINKNICLPIIKRSVTKSHVFYSSKSSFALFSSNTGNHFSMNSHGVFFNDKNSNFICGKCVSCNQIRSCSGHGDRNVFYGHNAKPVFSMERQISLPELQEGEVLVKVKAATICISDIHTVTGARIEPTPSVLGHEATVEIVDHKRDPKIFNLKQGDRATFGIADTCGECEFCRNNLSQKCVKLFKYGHAAMSNGSGFNGSYASHIVIRKGTSVIKLPDVISDDLAASINCALATMVNCVDQIPANNLKPGNKALIQGDGMLGLYACALLDDMGFGEIYVTGHQTDRRDLIKKFGAIPLTPSELAEKKDLINKIDVAIEVCGDPIVVPEGMKVLKPGAAYIFVGMVHPQSKLEISGEQIIRKCLTIRGIHNYEAKHLKQSVDFLERTINNYPYDKLVHAKHFKLEELTEAIEMAKKKVYPRICVLP